MDVKGYPMVCQWMARVPNTVEKLPKILTAWVGCTSVTGRRQTDRRQTEGRQHIANVNVRKKGSWWRVFLNDNKNPFPFSQSFVWLLLTCSQSFLLHAVNCVRFCFWHCLRLFSERDRTGYMLSPSVCRLSVTFLHPTQPVEIFGNISTAFGTLAIHW